MLSDKTLRLTVDRELACPRFVEIVLATPRLRLQIEASATGTSGSMRNLSQEKLCNLLLPIPPMAEQRRIVAACASLDRVVERLERTAGKLRSVRDATISKMLARFSGSHVMVPVGERAEIQSGITLGPQRRAGGNSAAYLRVANVRMGWINGEDIAEIEELDTDRPRYEISDGDLLVVEGHADPGQIGRAALVSPVHAGMLYQNHLFRVRFESDLPIFAEAWLNSNASRTYWRQRCATSSGLYTINSRQLAGLPFPLVNMDEQYRLAALMEAGGRRIAAVEARIAKLRVLRRGLVGDLLAGRVRTEDL
jgi:type I restriction enzyme S subunit